MDDQFVRPGTPVRPQPTEQPQDTATQQPFPAQSEQQYQTQPPKKSGGKVKKFFKFLLILVLLGALGYGGYLFKEERDNANGLQSQVDSLKTEIATLESADQAQAGDGQQELVVVYEPSGAFNDKEKSELQEKLVGPLADYEPDKYISIIIEENSPDVFVGGDSDDKYLVTAIGEDGVVISFVYGSKKDGIDWYVPECGESDCEFSDEYRQKYPEVVKQYEQSRNKENPAQP